VIRRSCVAALVISLCAAAVAATVNAPPAARTVQAADDAFGLHLPDPYRWMEGENNADFTAWLRAQGAYGRAQLDAAPRLQFWRERLGAVARAGMINRLQQPMGGRIFFLRLTGGREGVLMVRDSDGSERTLLDPAARQQGSLTTAITGYSPSADGKRVAVNVQRGGSELTTIEVLNVDDASAAPDVIADVWGEFQASWLPDGKAFVYTQLAPLAERDATDPLLNTRVRLHTLGSSPAADPVLVRRGANPTVALTPNEFPLLDLAEDSDFALLIIGGARPETRVCLARRSAALRPEAKWTCPIDYADNVQQVALHRNQLYLASMKGHPNGELLRRSLSTSGHAGPAHAVIPADANAVITGLATASDGLYVRRMQGGPDELLRLDYPGGAPRSIALPYGGAVYLLNADPRAAGVLFTLQGWTRPRTAFEVSARAPQPQDLHLGADSPADYSGVTADEVTAVSADGTEVPLTIIHRRDAQRPLGEAAIVEGYGGYGISSQPVFNPFVLEWVQAGHVYAHAHVRGGGEKGDLWRIAGSGTAKERGVEDFLACAQALVTSGWADRARLVAWGGSMGGVLIGGAITRQPETFAAAAIQAGELNPSRLLAAKNGANQFAEVGDPRTETGLKSVAAMDPYLRIKAGTAYPAVLLVVGVNDNRVAPWNSGKFGARLLAASSSGKPVWFRLDDDMGHFNTAQEAQSREQADVYTFAELQAAR
jgi:prolyl oligopeptidase